MNFNRKAIITLLLITLIMGMDKNETSPIDVPPMFPISNILWTLESVETEGKAVDLSPYTPFHLVYTDRGFFGDDGCNHFTGIYRISGDTVITTNARITKKACINMNRFSWGFLSEPYHYQIRLSDGELTLQNDRSVYTFGSDFTEDVDSRLIHKDWRLTSNPSVRLSFDATRTFQSEYICGDDDTGCGSMGGVFGIGEDNTIMFYRNEGGGSDDGWSGLLKSILRSSSYMVRDGTLTLTNESDGATFEFTPPE